MSSFCVDLLIKLELGIGLDCKLINQVDMNKIKLIIDPHNNTLTLISSVIYLTDKDKS